MPLVLVYGKVIFFHDDGPKCRLLNLLYSVPHPGPYLEGLNFLLQLGQDQVAHVLPGTELTGQAQTLVTVHTHVGHITLDTANNHGYQLCVA